MRRPPIHPGEILGDELKEIGIEAGDLARQLNLPEDRIDRIIRGDMDISADMALRLGHWFRNSAEFWLNLQTAYDLRLAQQTAGAEIKMLPVMPELAVASGARSSD